MRYPFIIFLFSLMLASIAIAEDGLINVKSSHTVQDTADRLESVLKEKSMTVFARIKHSDGAEKAGINLRPTELIIFGNPNVGAPLMKCNQTVGIDLPQKALIWKDDSGQVWLTYNDPQYLSKRHELSACAETITKVEKALSNFAKAATKP